MALGQKRNRALIPGAIEALEQLKFQVAQEIGIPNYRGYLGEVPARYNGAVGGNMVRRMIALAEQQLAQTGGTIPQAVLPPTARPQGAQFALGPVGTVGGPGAFAGGPTASPYQSPGGFGGPTGGFGGPTGGFGGPTGGFGGPVGAFGPTGGYGPGTATGYPFQAQGPGVWAR